MRRLALGLALAGCAGGGDDGTVPDGRGLDATASVVDGMADAPVPAVDAAGPWLNETDAPAEADFCNLQFPATLALAPGAPSETIYARIYEAGRTEAAGGSPGLVAQLGVGPASTAPSSAGWTWVAATFNVQVGNDDEYGGTITAPEAAGAYAYAARFSIDGAGFTACDLDGAGANDGLALDLGQLGALTVTP